MVLLVSEVDCHRTCTTVVFACVRSEDIRSASRGIVSALRIVEVCEPLLPGEFATLRIVLAFHRSLVHLSCRRDRRIARERQLQLNVGSTLKGCSANLLDRAGLATDLGRTSTSRWMLSTIQQDSILPALLGGQVTSTWLPPCSMTARALRSV